MSKGGGLRRDKYPQFFCGTLTETAANTFTTTSINIPTNLLMQGGKQRTIIEVLWVDMDVRGHDGATASVVQLAFTIGGTPTAVLAQNDPRYFAGYNDNVIITTSGLFHDKQQKRFNLQSKDGYGYLIAGDRFHISIVGGSQTNALGLNWRIYYREVGVSVMEYVGIVQQQSQQ